MCKKKASSTLDFIKRKKELKMCPKKTRLQSYISLVRSTLEYGAVIWDIPARQDPFTQNEIDEIERRQRKAT